MNSRDPVAEMLTAIGRVLPRLPSDIEQNLRAAVSGALGRLDLVTREEFDVQRELLVRARTRLNDLEKRLADLEQQRSR